jgi:hypothetical protein
MTFPKQRGVVVARPLSLLRRQRDRARQPGRAAAACACALLALGLPAVARAGSLQPDPPATPAPVGLQPDTFPAVPAASAPKPAPVTHVAPATAAAGSVVSSLETQPAEKPPPSIVAPVETPLAPAATHVVTRHTQTKAHHAARHRAVVRIRLPVRVRAVSTMRLGLLVPARAVAVAPAVPARRDLAPGALALLALVVTSGCFLAVAARHRQEGLGP